MWKLAVTCTIAWGLLACVFPPLKLEGKTCTTTEPCPQNLVCVLGALGEGVCREPANVCSAGLEECEFTYGVCAGKQRYCDAQGPEQVCTARSYGLNYEPVESQCDGLDNDCDGVVDASRFVELSADAVNFDLIAIDGGYLAAYEAPFDLGGGRVYLRRFDQSLTPVGPAKDALVDASTGHRYSQDPRLLAVDAGIYLAFIEYGATLVPANMMLRQVTEAGDVMIAPSHKTGIVIKGLATAGVFGPLILTSAPDGLTVGWVRANDYFFRAIRASFDGAPISPIQTFGTVTAGSREFRSADLALSPSGFWAAWSAGSQLRWQLLDFQLNPKGDGGSLSFPNPISEVVAQVLSDSQPLFATVVTGEADGRIAVGRATQEPPKTVGPALSTLPVLLRATALQGGEVWLVWTHLNGVSGAVVDDDGTVGAVDNLITDAGTSITELSVGGKSPLIAVAMNGKENPAQGAPRIIGRLYCSP